MMRFDLCVFTLKLYIKKRHYLLLNAAGTTPRRTSGVVTSPRLVHVAPA